MPGLLTASGHGGDTHGLLELLDGQFDALMAALSTSNAALYQLAAATTQQYAEIKAVLTNLSAATAATSTPRRITGTRTGSLPSDQRETEKRILIIQAAVKNKWEWKASVQLTATASAPVTAEQTAMTKITSMSMPKPAQVQLAQERK